MHCERLNCSRGKRVRRHLPAPSCWQVPAAHHYQPYATPAAGFAVMNGSAVPNVSWPPLGNRLMQAACCTMHHAVALLVAQSAHSIGHNSGCLTRWPPFTPASAAAGARGAGRVCGCAGAGDHVLLLAAQRLCAGLHRCVASTAGPHAACCVLVNFVPQLASLHRWQPALPCPACQPWCSWSRDPHPVGLPAGQPSARVCDQRCHRAVVSAACT